MLNLSGGAEQKQDLQFDRVSTPGAEASATNASASCTACHTAIVDVYYDVSSHTLCAKCRDLALAAVETPLGLGPLLVAGLFGFGGAVLGAIVYFVVAFKLKFGIGIVAIVCGYLVGAGVRKGTGNRGGRRFQVLAVLLTYISIAMAWSPIAIGGFVENVNKRAAVRRTTTSVTEVSDSGESVTVTAAAPRATAGDNSANTPRGSTGLALVVGLGVLLGLLIALPLIASFSVMPMGLVSLAFMFFAMQRAWRTTAAPKLVVNGPYRVGGGAASPAV